VTLDEQDVLASFRQLGSAGQPDDAAAHYDCFNVH
jgi:hypothetical protein